MGFDPLPRLGAGAPPAKDEPGTAEKVTAGFSDVLYIPGKAIVCAGSGFLWLTFMVVTFGHSYDAAANFIKGGCGGKWLITGEDIKFGPSQ